MANAAKILFCRCAYFDVLDRSVADEALARLRADPRVQDEPSDDPRLAAGAIALHVIDDLCALAARKDPVLAELAGVEGLTVVACYPRAVRALFAAAGTKLPDSARVVNMRKAPTEEIVRAALRDEYGDSTVAPRGAVQTAPSGRRGFGRPKRSTSPPPDGVSASCTSRAALPTPSEDPDSPPQTAWKPWFPVIDRDRCANCRHCLNFCLFGVYAADDDGRVHVVKPTACKTFCPACARICPSAAIIFPKFPDPPINGDEVTAEHLRNQKVRIDPAALAGGDVHAALRRRIGPAPGESLPSARARLCPDNVVKELNIPPEVLESVRKEFAGEPAPNSPRRKAGVDSPNAAPLPRNADAAGEPSAEEGDEQR